MSPIDESEGEIVPKLSEIVKKISSFPECKNTSRFMWSNLVRRIKLLSPMFEELLDREEPEIGHGGLKSLCVALNSAKDLLFWVNEASKLYQATHNEEVSSKFLKTTSQIEEALSEIDYNNLNLSEEVKEQIELVHAQFRRAKANKPDSTYEQLQDDLKMAENEEEPGIAVLRRLSQNLNIRTIEDLRKESRDFHEMVIKSNGDVGSSFEMMSAIFRRLNDYLVTASSELDLSDAEKGFSKHIRSPVIPDEFRCPVSLELMSDPVIISTGQEGKMREWMYVRNIDDFLNNEFLAGVEQFLEFCKSMPTYNQFELRCPCRRCKNKKLISVDDVHYHLVKEGFVPNYYHWVSHGETDEMFAALLAESRQHEGYSSTDPAPPVYGEIDN